MRSAPDLTRFVPVAPDETLRRGRRHLVCYLGVMGPQDGVDYALRSLASLRDDLGRDDVQAAFVGHGDAWDDLVALAHELGLDDRVEFTGRVSDEDVARYLSTADVCLAPDPKNPLNDVSTMNKIVEYMAMSRPLVSFDLIEARVSAGDAALYATPNDEREFARLIAELLDDPERRARMGALGRQRVEQELSWEHSRRHLLEAYETLLARGGALRSAGQRTGTPDRRGPEPGEPVTRSGTRRSPPKRLEPGSGGATACPQGQTSAGVRIVVVRGVRSARCGPRSNPRSLAEAGPWFEVGLAMCRDPRVLACRDARPRVRLVRPVARSERPERYWPGSPAT